MRPKGTILWSGRMAPASTRVPACPRTFRSDSSQISLVTLNERSREIFRQIVESYLATGEPMGSRQLSRLISVAVVAGLGAQRDAGPRGGRPHLRAPYLGGAAPDRARPALFRRRADAGRRPFREGTARRSKARVAASGRSVESLLTEASGLLSGLTHAAGVVLTAKSDVRLKHIEFVRLEPERALVVLVAEDGQVEKPRRQSAARAAVVRADRSLEFSSMRAFAARRSPRPAPRSMRRWRRAAPSSTSSPKRSSRPGSRAGRAATSRTAS